MIKSVVVTNYLGESIEIELRFPEKSGFLVRDGGIDGLGPGKANVNTTDLASYDGVELDSVNLPARNIVFQLGFLEKPGMTIEDIRHLTYKYFPIKKPVNLKFETDSRLCEIFGNIESNEPTIFSSQEGTVISVFCPDPYFYSVNRSITTFSGSQSTFTFPFSNKSLTEKLIKFGNIQLIAQKLIHYDGDSEVGLLFFIHAIGPGRNLRIVNVRTQETMHIDDTRLIDIVGSSIVNGDDIFISTIKGDKFIYLLRNGIEYNIFNALDKNVDWFQLSKGNNIFAYTSDDSSSNLQFRIENQVAFEGI